MLGSTWRAARWRLQPETCYAKLDPAQTAAAVPIYSFDFLVPALGLRVDCSWQQRDQPVAMKDQRAARHRV